MDIIVNRQETPYDGAGDLSHLHATIYAHDTWLGRWLVDCVIDHTPERGESWTYGETLPLTRKMAEEIATKWVAGRKVPRHLEWR
jgi:hypothetical protein